ncbi:Exonuclease RNase T and DNA polymerase III [Pseudomonas chlororaphis]|uniref:Exonuclease RNase T and DNA polymerase III n=1 Tax=Pseudomonas chlororaphis TaxID=587753 RepID=A0A3G7TK93_9PSED|nr:3'-5' exonuclease [Pseudomonas chlororaphis]AZE47271.1 Exonuclease RNase T and DNA polymerase III [Pseudomonas chlororaphis]
MQVKHASELQAFRDRLAGSRYLFCVDLEATCDEYPPSLTAEQRLAHPLCITPDEMETIEVGLTVLDLHDRTVQVDEFSRFVRPIFHPILTSFCKRLTTISQQNVDSAATYDDVKLALEKFTVPYQVHGVIWCSWGKYDADQLKLDAARLSTSPMLAGLAHVDVDAVYQAVFGKEASGLKSAVESVGIVWHGQYHRAIEDARNLGMLVATLLNSYESTSIAL